MLSLLTVPLGIFPMTFVLKQILFDRCIFLPFSLLTFSSFLETKEQSVWMIYFLVHLLSAFCKLAASAFSFLHSLRKMKNIRYLQSIFQESDILLHILKLYFKILRGSHILSLSYIWKPQSLYLCWSSSFQMSSTD